MKFIIIIPARYASTRFPGKPLAMLGGKPVVQHVCERAAQATPNVLVATDDRRIADAVEGFGMKAVMTKADHRSGTDRCWEAYRIAGGGEDVIINVQGDEPFVKPEQINLLMECFDTPDTQIATLIKPFAASRPFEELQNPNAPKVVVGTGGNALYFSRSVVPYLRNVPQAQWPAKHQFYTHLGMYAYRAAVLGQLTKLTPSALETAESLEQLRWLENGFSIATRITNSDTIGIDTPEDLEKARKLL